jgi:Na+/phosphate symporter
MPSPRVICLVVLIVGAILYAATDAKPSEFGRMMFFAGLLAYLMNFLRTPGT